VRRRHLTLNFAGSVHFVTTVTRERGRWFVASAYCQAILTLFEGYRARQHIDCLGYVLMPDHLHALLRQNSDGQSVAELMRGFKRETSKLDRPFDYPGETLWADRYDDVPIPRIEAVSTRLGYMHHNPVKGKWSATAEDYPWSSARVFAQIEPGPVMVVHSDGTPVFDGSRPRREG
jgi:putative transposase